MDYEKNDLIVEKLIKVHLMNQSVESKEILAVTQAYLILKTDAEILDWLQLMMLPDSDYCEIFLAGLRNFKTVIATSFQIESSPEKFKTVNATSIREAIRLAMKDSERVGDLKCKTVKNCQNCDCGYFPVSRCDCSCHDLDD